MDLFQRKTVWQLERRTAVSFSGMTLRRFVSCSGFVVVLSPTDHYVTLEKTSLLGVSSSLGSAVLFLH